MTSRVAWILAAAQLAALAPPARAEPREERALAHLDRGVAAYRAGDYARARSELTAASALAPDRANPYRWLAMTEVQLGDCRDALVHIESFLSRAPAGDPRVGELLALRTQCVETGRLSVESTPGGAALHVDGGPAIATTPVRDLALPVGRHALRLDKPGFTSASDTADVTAGAPAIARFTLLAEPARARPLATRWWFWTAVGAVALTAAGVTYGVTRGGGDARLPPVTCGATGCRP